MLLTKVNLKARMTKLQNSSRQMHSMQIICKVRMHYLVRMRISWINPAMMIKERTEAKNFHLFFKEKMMENIKCVTLRIESLAFWSRRKTQMRSLGELATIKSKILNSLSDSEDKIRRLHQTCLILIPRLRNRIGWAGRTILNEPCQLNNQRSLVISKETEHLYPP